MAPDLGRRPTYTMVLWSIAVQYSLSEPIGFYQNGGDSCAIFDLENLCGSLMEEVSISSLPKDSLVSASSLSSLDSAQEEPLRQELENPPFKMHDLVTFNCADG